MKHKNIRIFPDFSSSGIWENAPRYTMIEYEELKLSKELINEFKEWIDYYEDSFDETYSKPDAKRAKIFNQTGIKLAKKIKQLYPKCHIEYWAEDETNNRANIQEITL